MGLSREFTELITKNKVLYACRDCGCCYGLLTRGKVLKEVFPELVLRTFKEHTFQIEQILGDEAKDIEVIIHDFLINRALFLYGLKRGLPQYFLTMTNQEVFSGIKKVILPYPEEVSPEYTKIKQEKMFAGLICDDVVEEANITKIKEKYNLSNLTDKPLLVVTVSSGFPRQAEGVFSYVNEEFSTEDYQIVFIYGKNYSGKLFDNVITTYYEENIIELFSLAHTVVCMGGYNTLAECVSLKVPRIIIIPKANCYADEESDKFARYYSGITIKTL